MMRKIEKLSMVIFPSSTLQFASLKVKQSGGCEGQVAPLKADTTFQITSRPKNNSLIDLAHQLEGIFKITVLILSVSQHLITHIPEPSSK
jgi:hypothetical protein